MDKGMSPRNATRHRGLREPGWAALTSPAWRWGWRGEDSCAAPPRRLPAADQTLLRAREPTPDIRLHLSAKPPCARACRAGGEGAASPGLPPPAPRSGGSAPDPGGRGAGREGWGDGTDVARGMERA